MIAVSCITEFEFQQHVGKDILVIEGFIADKCNESKIVLSKSTTFSNLEGVSFINDANVKVVDEIGNSNDFFFSNQAYYPVEPAFCAKKGVKYRLEVYYNEKSYHSDWVTMQQSAEIENVSWSVIDENLPVEGSCRSLVAEISTKESNDSCFKLLIIFLEGNMF